MDLSTFTNATDALKNRIGLGSSTNTIGNNNPLTAQAQPNQINTNPNASEQLSGYSTFMYPTELGTTRYPYYLVFYINAQSQSTLGKNTDQAGDSQAAQSNRVGNSTSGTVQNQFSAFNNGLNSTLNGASSLINSATSLVGGVINVPKLNTNANLNIFTPPAKRTTVALALPMPNELNMNSDAEYATLSPGMLGSNLQAMLSGEGKQLMKNAGQTIVQDIPKFLGDMSDQIFGSSGAGEKMQQLFLKSQGIAINERKEQIFKGMNSRTFTFTWTLVPRTPDESDEIRNIIYWLRYNQHPELDVSSDKNTHGLNLIVPNEFDLEFHHQGSPMTGIPKISTCYLDSVTVNYTPLGKWIAFDGTENPVATHLTLKFTEIEPLTRTQIELGY